MSLYAFLAAAWKSLPLILKIIDQIRSAAEAKVNQDIGYQQAVAEGLQAVSDQLAQADEAVAEAQARQAAHPNSDDGRDTQFRRD